MIDCSKNWFLAALYLAAITFDAAAKEKVAILATLLMMLCVSANMIAPPTASIAPYPSLEGITGNPLLLPICGTQIVLLTLGVLFASPSTKKKKPAATRAARGRRARSAARRARPDDARAHVLIISRHPLNRRETRAHEPPQSKRAESKRRRHRQAHKQA